MYVGYKGEKDVSKLRFHMTKGSFNDEFFNICAVKDGEEVNFTVKTYTLFYRVKVPEDEKKWDKVLSIVYEYFDSLSNEELDIIFNFYKRSRNNLIRINEDNYKEVANTISEDICYIVDNKFNLVKSCIDFVHNNQNLKYPNLDNIGKEAHHKQENTFYLEDYKLLTGISLFCKIFFPIFGNYIEFTKDYISKIYKENEAAQIILPLFNRRETYAIINKLFQYTKSTIEGRLSKGRTKIISKKTVFIHDFNFGHSGITYDDIISIVYSTLFVRKLVLFEPYRTIELSRDMNGPIYGPSDMMKALNTLILSTFRIIESTTKEEANMLIRFGPEDFSPSGNTLDAETPLDKESIIFETKMDTLSMINLGVDRFIKKSLISYNIDEDMFNETKNHYFKNRIYKISPITKLIISLYAKEYIEGYDSLRFIKSERYTGLVSLVQLICCYENIPNHLIHFLTASMVVSDSMPIPNEKYNFISYSSTNNPFYQQIENYYSDVQFEDVTITSVFGKFTKEIINKKYIYNTADTVYDLLGEVNTNDQDYQYTEEIIIDLQKFLVSKLIPVQRSIA